MNKIVLIKVSKGKAYKQAFRCPECLTLSNGKIYHYECRCYTEPIWIKIREPKKPRGGSKIPFSHF